VQVVAISTIAENPAIVDIATTCTTSDPAPKTTAVPQITSNTRTYGRGYTNSLNECTRIAGDLRNSCGLRSGVRSSAGCSCFCPSTEFTDKVSGCIRAWSTSKKEEDSALAFFMHPLTLSVNSVDGQKHEASLLELHFGMESHVLRTKLADAFGPGAPPRRRKIPPLLSSLVSAPPSCRSLGDGRGYTNSLNECTRIAGDLRNSCGLRSGVRSSASARSLVPLQPLWIW
jgi:hypothetical protein